MENFLTDNQTERLKEARELVKKARQITDGIMRENHPFLASHNGQVLEKAITQSSYSLELLTLDDEV